MALGDWDWGQAFDLRLDTKYYSADVWLGRVAEKRLVSPGIAESVEAVVVRLGRDWGLAAAEAWLPFLAPLEATVRVLAVPGRPVDEAAREAVSRWALQVSQAPS